MVERQESAERSLNFRPDFVFLRLFLSKRNRLWLRSTGGKLKARARVQKFAVALLISALALPVLAAVPVADFAWTPQDPPINSLVQIEDLSTGATSTTLFVENSHGQPGSTAALAFNAPGVYELKMVATNASGSSQKIRWINAGLPAEARMNVSKTTVGIGESVAFEDRSTGLVQSRNWTFGDGASSSAEGASHAYATAGTFTVTLRASYSGGSPKTTTRTITVQSAPVELQALFDWTPEIPFIGQSVVFRDQSLGSPASRNWSFGDGSDDEKASSQNPSHKFKTPGKYVVSLSVKSGAKSAFTSKEIYVAAAGGGLARLEPDFLVEPSCLIAGEPMQFIDRSDGFPLTWKWTFGNGRTSNERSPSGVFTTPGDYLVTLELFDGVQTRAVSRTITVHQNFQLVPRADFSSPCCSATGLVRQFQNTSTNATSFLWDFGDGSTSTEKNPFHAWSQPGTYMIGLTASNDQGDHRVGRSIVVADVSTQPSADFVWEPAANIGVGQTVSFVNRSSFDAVSFQWTVSEPGQPARQYQTRNIETSFPQKGSVTVTLVALDAYGNSGSVTRQVPVVDGRLIASFVCRRTGSHTEIATVCGGCRCVDYDEETRKCLAVQPSDCDAPPFNFNSTQSNRGCQFSYPVSYDDYSCTDQSIGSPNEYLWSVPGPSFNVEVPGKDVTFKVQSSPPGGAPSFFWVSHTVHRLVDGETSTAHVEVRDGSGTGQPLKAEFTWSPPFPRAGDEVTFQQTGDGSTFEWTVDGEHVFRGPSFTYKFPSGGRHSVLLRVGGAAVSEMRAKDVEVAPKATPEFKTINSRFGPCYFSTAPLQVELEATMNWGGTPASARYRINDGPERSIAVSGDQLAFAFPSSDLRFPTTGEGMETNAITITAKNAAGDEGVLHFRLLGYHTGDWLANVEKTSNEGNRYIVQTSTNIPQPEWRGEIEFPGFLPVIGGKVVGLQKTQGTVETTFRTDCSASTLTRGQTGFKFGVGVITGAIYGREEIMIAPSGIFTARGTLGFELAGIIEPPPVLVAQAIPTAAPLCALPFIDTVCEVLKVKSELKLSGAAEFDFSRTRGKPEFLGGRAILSPSMKIGLILEPVPGMSAEVWGGGSASFTLSPIPPILRKTTVGIESVLRVSMYMFRTEQKWAFVCTNEGSWSCLGQPGVIPTAQSVEPVALTPIPIHQQPEVAVGRLRARGDSVVLESISPLAAPEAAASGNEIMAVYLAENPAAPNPMQRTDVRYTTRQDGTWSSSAPVTSDAFGDFAPTLTAATDGRFVATWQRLKNASLRLEDVANVNDIPKLNREMEIVTATWSPGNRTWSTPFALTENDVFDHDVQVVGLADGRVLAIWLRDPGNGFAGTTSSPTSIVARVFTGSAWGPETTIASGLTGVQGLAAASSGNGATIALSRDKDGNATNQNDREIAIATFANGTWSALTDFTTDSVADLAPEVVYGSDGVRIVWLSNADLVWQAVGKTREIVRASEGSASLIDFGVTVAPAGQFVVVWSESVQGTADVIARTYDPALKLWSEDIPLTRNDAVESALSAFFADGKLQVAGLETNSVYTNETRVIDGQTVVIPSVAGPGSVNLIHLDKELVVDLSIDQNTVTVSSETPSNGQQVKLTASVCNDGDLPLRDVAVAIYAGRGVAGLPLSTATIAGDWRGGETRTVEISFPYSESAQEVTLVVDPLGLSGDRSLANNQAYFSYRNMAPEACLQLNHMMGNAPMTVTLDGRCSTDPDGKVVASQWSFGDGASAFGDVATHTFTSQGTYTVTLIVTDDLGRSSTAASSVYVNSLGELRNNQSSSFYLPVAGRTAGASGTFFVSDATVFNPNGASDLVVDALYLPDGRLDYHYARLVVPSERTLDLSDLIAKTFHASGVGWVRFDVSDPSAVITSRTYNKQPIGTAGSFIPAATNQDATRVDMTRVFLQDWRSGYRTNVGITEISGDGADVTVSAFDASGALAGQKTYQLGPWTHIQVNGDPLFQRAGRIEMTVTSGAILGYLSTIDNGTGDAVYQAGIDRGSIVSGSRWIVPTVGRLVGANNTRWRSDVRIWNGESAAQTVRFQLLRNGTAVDKQVVLQAGETLAYDDVVAALYPELSDNVIGVLTISGDGALFATSRIYNESSKGTYGMAAPPRMEGELLTMGDLRDLLQIASNNEYRCNFGMTALDGDADIRVRAFDLEGQLLGSKTYHVAARSNTQINGIFGDLGITAPQSAARLQVHVLSGKVYAYASVIDNKTGDAIFVEARR